MPADIRPFPTTPTSSPNSGNGNGGGRDDIRERLARIEIEIKHLASKEDLYEAVKKVEESTNAKWKTNIQLALAGISVLVILYIAFVK